MGVTHLNVYWIAKANQNGAHSLAGSSCDISVPFWVAILIDWYDAVSMYDEDKNGGYKEGRQKQEESRWEKAEGFS